MDPPNPILLPCPDCSAQMPETAAFCPGCGRVMQSGLRAAAKLGALTENVAAALAYLTFIPAIAFLLRDPYRKNRFVRFHSVQCLLFCVAALAVAAALRLASIILFMIPVLGPLLAVLLNVVIGLGAVVTWLVLLVKAFQGEMFKLPVLGDFAQQQSGATMT